MRPNKLRELLKSNKPTLSTHIHTTWPSVVEAIGHITWGYTARSSAPGRSISATSRRRLPTWRSSAPPSI